MYVIYKDIMSIFVLRLVLCLKINDKNDIKRRTLYGKERIRWVSKLPTLIKLYQQLCLL